MESNAFQVQQLFKAGGGGDKAPHRYEGVELSQHQQEYLLPHFFMLIVGKPGSGKTQLIHDLLADKNLYYKKFDYVYFVSPSQGKSTIQIPKNNKTTSFNFQWIGEKIREINKKQFAKINKYVSGGFSTDEVLEQISNSLQAGGPNPDIKDSNYGRAGIRIAEGESRFFNADVIKNLMGKGIKGSTLTQTQKKVYRQKTKTQPSDFQQEDTDWIEQNLVKKLNPSQQKDSHTNALFIFDDVIGEIKDEETNTKLAQLFLNRRHLIANGTVSIIVITQKYTYVPARIRSQASWLELFNLNPSDFDIIYKSVSVLPAPMWKQLLNFCFDNDKFSAAREKKYNHLGIHVERNRYFINFNLIQQ